MAASNPHLSSPSAPKRSANGDNEPARRRRPPTVANSAPILPVLLLLYCCCLLALVPPAHAEPVAVTAGPKVLPKLPPSVKMLTCTPSHCATVTSDNITAVCSQPDLVLLLDWYGCYHAVKARAGYRPEDLSNKSGGEVVWCATILRRLSKLHLTFVVSGSSPMAEECVRIGQQATPPAHHIFFVHAGWPDVISDQALMGGFLVRPPYREECTITMHFFGAAWPTIVWPGDLRYYLTVWPNRYNSHTFIEKPHDCPAASNFQPVPLPTYGVLFEKFKSMPDRVNQTDRLFNNATLWQELRQRVHLVVLDCSDVLADKLGWGPNWRDHVTCWRDSPLRNSISYHNLMMGAAFFLGLGATPVSPTPVECLYCRTPVIMPPYQHHVVAQHAGPREYYPIRSAQDVLKAVDKVLLECRVGLDPLSDGPDGGEDGGSSMAVRKTNSCFEEPGSLEAKFSEDAMARSLHELLQSRELLCRYSPNAAGNATVVTV